MDRYEKSKDVFPRNRIGTHVDEAISSGKRGCSFFAKITEADWKYRYIFIYIYIRDRSIDRMGKFVSENRWKKKSRYRPGVTVMRLSTDSLLRHHINIRSNLFERIFPRAARPEILSRSTATFYTRWLIPPFADILPQPRFPIVQTRYVSVYESTPTHPIQIPSVRIENRFRHELIIDRHRVRKPGTNSSILHRIVFFVSSSIDRGFINFLKIISSETRECRGTPFTTLWLISNSGKFPGKFDR